MDWCRLWHDMPNDPKFRTIARLSKSRTSDVISVFIHLMVSASANAGERGRTQPNAEDLASALDLETELVESILAAMEGRVMCENVLTGWPKRNPKREDGSPDRAKDWRETKKLEKLSLDANATERNRTQTTNRRDETRRDETRRETEVLPVNEHSSDREVLESISTTTNGQNGHSRGVVNGSGKKPSSSPPSENKETRLAQMQDVLYGYMAMRGTPYERKVKPPDIAIVKRCLTAIGNHSVPMAGQYLRERFVNHEQSPRHPNGPRGYAWFAPVLLAEFGGSPK